MVGARLDAVATPREPSPLRRLWYLGPALAAVPVAYLLHETPVEVLLPAVKDSRAHDATLARSG